MKKVIFFVRANFSELLLLIVSYARSLPFEVICYSNIIIVSVCSHWSQQLGVCVLPEVKLPQCITQMFHLPTIDRIDRAFASIL